MANQATCTNSPGETEASDVSGTGRVEIFVLESTLNTVSRNNTTEVRMKLLLLSATLILGVFTQAVALDYQTPLQINANGTPIQLSLGHANPLVTDWNADGLKDLLVGQYTGGKIRYYINEGSNAAPVFGSFTYMQADGNAISVSSG